MKAEPPNQKEKVVTKLKEEIKVILQHHESGLLSLLSNCSRLGIKVIPKPQIDLLRSSTMQKLGMLNTTLSKLGSKAGEFSNKDLLSLLDRAEKVTQKKFQDKINAEAQQMVSNNSSAANPASTGMLQPNQANSKKMRNSTQCVGSTNNNFAHHDGVAQNIFGGMGQFHSVQLNGNATIGVQQTPVQSPGPSNGFVGATAGFYGSPMPTGFKNNQHIPTNIFPSTSMQVQPYGSPQLNVASTGNFGHSMPFAGSTGVFQQSFQPQQGTHYSSQQQNQNNMATVQTSPGPQFINTTVQIIQPQNMAATVVMHQNPIQGQFVNGFISSPPAAHYSQFAPSFQMQQIQQQQQQLQPAAQEEKLGAQQQQPAVMNGQPQSSEDQPFELDDLDFEPRPLSDMQMSDKQWGL